MMCKAADLNRVLTKTSNVVVSAVSYGDDEDEARPKQRFLALQTIRGSQVVEINEKETKELVMFAIRHMPEMRAQLRGRLLSALDRYAPEDDAYLKKEMERESERGD